jgi:hypothetical protein
VTAEKLEARALALMEGSVTLNAIADKSEDEVEKIEFYRLAKELWIRYTRTRELAKRQKQREKENSGQEDSQGSGQGAQATGDVP